MRQQLLCTESSDSTGWSGLGPAVVLFGVAICLSMFGRDINYVVSVLHSNINLNSLIAFFSS
jgi:hypothetical protein